MCSIVYCTVHCTIVLQYNWVCKCVILYIVQYTVHWVCKCVVLYIIQYIVQLYSSIIGFVSVQYCILYSTLYNCTTVYLGLFEYSLFESLSMVEPCNCHLSIAAETWITTFLWFYGLKYFQFYSKIYLFYLFLFNILSF